MSVTAHRTDQVSSNICTFSHLEVGKGFEYEDTLFIKLGNNKALGLVANPRVFHFESWEQVSPTTIKLTVEKVQ